MWGEAALAFASADVVALSTGICRQGQDREGNGSGSCTGLGQSRSGRELEDRRPQQWKERTVYRRWQAGQRAGASGREGPGRRSPHAAVVTHGSRFCVQSWIPTFHGNFTPVEFVASDFFFF